MALTSLSLEMMIRSLTMPIDIFMLVMVVSMMSNSVIMLC